MPNSRRNLGQLSLTELAELRRQLDQVLADKVGAERRELQTRLASLESYGGKRQRSGRGRRSNVAKTHPLKGTKAPIKYRGPNGETWSGRGLPSRWLAELEKKGKKRESFLVKSPA